MRTKKRNGLAAPAAIILAAACIIGANTAAARIDDLTGQRDIYRSRAINWETEALEAEEQVQELKAQLAAAQQASAESAVHFRYAGEFGCTAYCSEKYEHICGTGDGITASGAPVQAGVTVAADPNIFPFGTALYIEGVGTLAQPSRETSWTWRWPRTKTPSLGQGTEPTGCGSLRKVQWNELPQQGILRNLRGPALELPPAWNKPQKQRERCPALPHDECRGHLQPAGSAACGGGTGCALFMWATFPTLPDALRVMESWGFIYKTAAFVWVKTNRKSSTPFWGMGAYTRANAEICLLGVTPGFNAGEAIKSHSVHQIIEAPVKAHSVKPDETRKRIVELMGDVPRIELFARQHAPGWDVWGDEVDLEVIDNG